MTTCAKSCCQTLDIVVVQALADFYSPQAISDVLGFQKGDHHPPAPVRMKTAEQNSAALIALPKH